MNEEVKCSYCHTVLKPDNIHRFKIVRQGSRWNGFRFVKCVITEVLPFCLNDENGKPKGCGGYHQMGCEG